jgi:nucleoside-diphosphate-sugar epimerase
MANSEASPREVALITGSSGFIGRALARKLSPRFHVVGLDQKPPPAGIPIEHVHVDFTSLDSLDTALRYVQATRGDRIASVIHLAAHYDFSGAPSPLYEKMNVHGTDALLFGLRRFDVEQFIYSSTMLVHAPTEPGRPLTEKSPLAPSWDYPESKLAAEELVRAHHDRVPALVLRLAGVYDDECHSPTLANQIQRIYERRLISHVFPGDTSRGQAMVHLDDTTDIFALAIARRAELPSETTLLAGEEQVMSYDELQRTLGRLIHDEEWETRSIPAAVAKAGAWLQDHVPGEEPFIKPWMIEHADEHFELDASRARDMLGWSPVQRLRSILPKMVALLRGDPQRFYELNQLTAPAAWEEQQPPPTPGIHAFGS